MGRRRARLARKQRWRAWNASFGKFQCDFHGGLRWRTGLQTPETTEALETSKLRTCRQFDGRGTRGTTWTCAIASSASRETGCQTGLGGRCTPRRRDVVVEARPAARTGARHVKTQHMHSPTGHEKSDIPCAEDTGEARRPQRPQASLLLGSAHAWRGTGQLPAGRPAKRSGCEGMSDDERWRYLDWKLSPVLGCHHCYEPGCSAADARQRAEKQWRGGDAVSCGSSATAYVHVHATKRVTQVEL